MQYFQNPKIDKSAPRVEGAILNWLASCFRTGGLRHVSAPLLQNANKKAARRAEILQDVHGKAARRAKFYNVDMQRHRAEYLQDKQG